MRSILFAVAMLCSFAAKADYNLAVSHPMIGSPTPPQCLPFVHGNVHTAVTASGAHTVAIMWCDYSKGIAYWPLTDKPGAAPSLACLDALRKSDLTSLGWISQAWAACVDAVTPGLPEQDDTQLALVAKWAPRVYVAAPRQNVYSMNADGTLGPQIVLGGLPAQLKGGTACDGPRAFGAADRYHMVKWRITINGFVLPENAYAKCEIYYPPPSGWNGLSSPLAPALQ